MRHSPRGIVVALAVVLAAGSGAALAGCTAQPLPDGAPTVSFTPGPCATKAPTGSPAASGVPGAGDRLVPFTPTGFQVCEYGPLLDRALVVAKVVDDPARAARVASFLDTTGSYDTGPFNCPMDDGAEVDFTFWNASSHLDLTLGLSGCRGAVNGSTFRLGVVPTRPFAEAAGLPASLAL